MSDTDREIFAKFEKLVAEHPDYPVVYVVDCLRIYDDELRMKLVSSDLDETGVRATIQIPYKDEAGRDCTTEGSYYDAGIYTKRKHWALLHRGEDDRLLSDEEIESWFDTVAKYEIYLMFRPVE